MLFVMTCSIREGAEQKVWHRLRQFGEMRRNSKQYRHNIKPKHIDYTQTDSVSTPMKIGVLGCMAERLKQRIFNECPDVDIVCGPDAYRDLPRLLVDSEAGHQSSMYDMCSSTHRYCTVGKGGKYFPHF
jgi:tRNA A37 methylthiotransferase MiaB